MFLRCSKKIFFKAELKSLLSYEKVSLIVEYLSYTRISTVLELSLGGADLSNLYFGIVSILTYLSIALDTNATV